MIPLIVIRPEPGCSATLAAARTSGLAAEGHPLFAVEPCRWTIPDPLECDALLVGSANAMRHGGAGLAALRHLPVYAVGQMTADAASQAGFGVAMVGSGGLQALLDTVPDDPPLRFLRLAGTEHVPLSVPAPHRVTSRILYTSKAVAMAPDLAQVLSKGALVLLHSAAAARHFAHQCDQLAIPRTAITLATLGPRIAAAAGTGWARVASAERPDDAALLALAATLVT